MIPTGFKFPILDKSSVGRDPPLEVKFSILKKPDTGQSGVTAFTIVRNETYFLPHFLQHYRDLGVREFWFLDDRSTDGTREVLLAQPDCGVFEANLAFGDQVAQLRFGEAAKTLVPRALLQGRWVLTVDADEFLLLPQALGSLDALVGALEGAGLKVARAVMLDFFPSTLRALTDALADCNPFALCPYFDAWETLNWPDRTREPKEFSLRDGVRPRMFARLLDTSSELRSLLHSYKFATMYKVPLLFWEADTEMFTPHHSTASPSDRIQLALAHFKFYPGYNARIADALSTKAYWRNSMEYCFLDIAARELLDWTLAGPRSRRFNSPRDVEEAGLLFSHITPKVDSCAYSGPT
jgi:hypothetical protein